MARARNIKPGFCQNELLVELPVETRLMFALLPMYADREGRMEDRPKRIKMQIFPADNFDTNEMLQQLHDSGFIQRYNVDGVDYIQIINFLKHQKPHQNEKASEIPEFSNQGSKQVQPRKQVSTTKEAATRADSLNPLTDSLNPSRADNARKPKKTGKRLPPGWKPSQELLTWAMTERTDLDIKRVIDSFTDYWIAKTGSAATKLDWDATFRNWVRNEKSNRSQQTGNGQRQNTVRDREQRNRAELERLSQIGNT